MSISFGGLPTKQTMHHSAHACNTQKILTSSDQCHEKLYGENRQQSQQCPQSGHPPKKNMKSQSIRDSQAAATGREMVMVEYTLSPTIVPYNKGA